VERLDDGLLGEGGGHSPRGEAEEGEQERQHAAATRQQGLDGKGWGPTRLALLDSGQTSILGPLAQNSLPSQNMSHVELTS
jgi:hypothetical protein